MSITETVVKILTTTLTARVAFRLILVVLSTVLALHYLHPLFSKLITSTSAKNLTESTILLLSFLIGVALGTLAFELINKIYLSIGNVIKSKKKRKAMLIVEAQEIATKAAQEELFIKNFRETYLHLDSKVKYILEKLLNNNVKINLDHENSRFLKNKGWIQLINTLPSNIGLFKIHPLIAQELKNINEKIIIENINSLINSELNGCKEVIRIFSHPNYHLENHEIIEVEYFESKSIISKCFYINEHREYLYVKWCNGYKEIFEDLANTKVRNDCEIALTKKSFSVGLNSSFRP
ncbi:hypothetical protein [Citrobacter freundii]|uniref:hypothetical protein n=1 Tax=Citrobacter freundii TaxID=546 RepID=UPI00397E2184